MVWPFKRNRQLSGWGRDKCLQDSFVDRLGAQSRLQLSSCYCCGLSLRQTVQKLSDAYCKQKWQELCKITSSNITFTLMHYSRCFYPYPCFYPNTISWILYWFLCRSFNLTARIIAVCNFHSKWDIIELNCIFRKPWTCVSRWWLNFHFWENFLFTYNSSE